MVGRSMLPTIVVDTREQAPWAPCLCLSGKRHVLPSVSHGLSFGDYAIDGYESALAIERKSLQDAAGSAIGSWENELTKVARAEVAGARYVVLIEAVRADVLANGYWGQASPRSILARWDSMALDLGVPVVWGGPREECERLCGWMLARWWGKRIGLEK